MMRPRFRGRINHVTTADDAGDFLRLHEERISATQIALGTIAALASNCTDVLWATQVTNHDTELRVNWFGCAHHQGAVEAPSVVWVVIRGGGVHVLHVEPLEVTHVGLWVERRARTNGADRTWVEQGHHARQEDDRVRVRSFDVSRAEFCLGANGSSHRLIRQHFFPNSTFEGVAAGEVVDGVVEATDRTLNAQRCEKLLHALVVPQERVLRVGFAHDGIGGFHVRDKHELRATFCQAEGTTIQLSTVLNQVGVPCVQDVLGQAGGGGDGGEVGIVVGKTGSGNHFPFSNAGVFQDRTTLPSVGNDVAEVLEHFLDLLVDHVGVTGVVHADAFGLLCLLDEGVSAFGISARNHVASNGAGVRVGVD